MNQNGKEKQTSVAQALQFNRHGQNADTRNFLEFRGTELIVYELQNST